MLETLRRPLRFGLVGICNTAVDFAVFLSLLKLGVPAVPAAVAGFACGTVNSYLLNRYWTFRDAPRRRWRVEFRNAAATALLGVALTALIVRAVAPLAGAIPAKLAAIAVGFAFNYVCNRMLVFPAALLPSPSALGRPRGQI